MDLGAVIAPNGLGHFRRVVRELDALLAAHPALQAGLVCQRWQLEAMRGWAPLDRLLATGTAIETGALSRTFRWAADGSNLDEESLVGWVDKLKLIDWLMSATRVLSDNLAGVLEVRPDATLGGSFLWSDVLEPFAASNGAVQKFVERERQLLRAHQPSMLCVGDLAMAGVLQRTRAIRMPWLCEWSLDRAPADVPAQTIGVLGGATGTANDRLGEVVRQLLKDENVSIRVDKGLKAHFASESRVAIFEHDRDAYRALSLAFVRPGVGTITDCVAGQVPMLLLDEPDNLEMAHNARAMRELGVAEILEVGAELRALDVARHSLAADRWNSSVAAFRALHRDGLREAVEWLSNWIGA